MSWVITGLVLTGATTYYTMEAQKAEGKQEQYNLEHQAYQEGLSAQNEEIRRRERLNKVLAANIASASASGILGEGTPQSVSLENARRASSSEGAESLSDRIREDLLKRQGREAYKTGKTQAKSTLLKGVTQGVRLM